MEDTEIKLVTDHKLLAEAFRWEDKAPRWFRDSQACEFETLEDFLETAADRLFYGIFINGSMTALIRLNPFANKIFSLDLFAKRKTDFQTLLYAAESLKEYLFEQQVANGFFGWVVERNRGTIKLYKALGFSHNGVARYKGQHHGKVAKWLLMICGKVNAMPQGA